MFVFLKIWHGLLSCYLRFGIRPLNLLPTKQNFCLGHHHRKMKILIKLWFEKVPSSRIASRLNHQQPLRVEVKPFRVVLSKRKWRCHVSFQSYWNFFLYFFHPFSFHQFPAKTPKNTFWLSGVFRGYEMGKLAKNGLI